MTRFEEDGGDVERFHDCLELTTIAAKHGLRITPYEAYLAWNEFSDSMAAGWMGFSDCEHTANNLRFHLMEPQNKHQQILTNEPVDLHDVDAQREHFEQKGGDPYRFHDCLELATIAAKHRLHITPYQAYIAWNGFSDSMAAGWMGFSDCEQTADDLRSHLP